jgi:hypothetical protein
MCFSYAEGDVTRIIVTGCANTIRKNITINKQCLESVSSEYAESLTKIIEGFKKYNIPKEQTKPIQNGLYDFTKEVEGINPDEKVSIVKQKNINSKFPIFAEKVLGVLPRTADTVSAFRRLARFSKLIGEGARQLTEAIQNQKLLILYE